MEEERMQEKRKEAEFKHNIAIEMQRMLWEITGDGRMGVLCKLDELEAKIRKDVLDDKEAMEYDFTPVINTIEQATAMYDDIVKEGE